MSATTRDVLERALEIVRDGGWAQHGFALDRAGNPKASVSLQATRWCAGGAISLAANEFGVSWSRAVGELYAVVGPIIPWNDHGARTLDDVIEAFKQAIVSAPLEEA